MRFRFIILLTISLLSLTSCAHLYYPKMRTYERIYMGMSLQEFLDKHRKARMLAVEDNSSIYTIRYLEYFMNETFRKMYYFDDNKLYKVEKLVPIDYRVMVDK